jgi:hypothetical protein
VLRRIAGLFLSRKRRDNLMQRLTGHSRTSGAFIRFNRYLILRLRRR